jgi:hypothetical protein
VIQRKAAPCVANDSLGCALPLGLAQVLVQHHEFLRLSMRRTKMTNTKAAIKQATATRRMKSSWITWR